MRCFRNYEKSSNVPIRAGGGTYLPSAPRIDADQKISEMAEGKAWSDPHFPYFCVKGSIIVTYLASRIFLAKKVPPETIERERESRVALKWGGDAQMTQFPVDGNLNSQTVSS